MDGKTRQLIRLLRMFYVKNLSYYREGQTTRLRPLYEHTCQQLGRMVPVHYHFDPAFRPSALEQKQKLIVIANHIQTPFLVPIKGRTYLQPFGLQPSDLIFEQINPLIFRHYPIVNFLREHHFTTHIVGGTQPGILSEFARHWGEISIPDERYKGRYAILKEQVLHLSGTKRAVIVFPEGKDSGGYLHLHRYYIQPFRSGFAALAKELNLAIQAFSLAFDLETFQYHTYVHPLIPPNQVQTAELKTLVEMAQDLIETGIHQALPDIKVISLRKPARTKRNTAQRK